MTATTIDEVIDILEDIIQTAKEEESCLGYFAALYQKVTMAVKAKLSQDYFDDPARMERLDVVFANRYLAAYADHRLKKPITASWEAAFSYAGDEHLIILQHLLLGMNAHINLDLGIAAAEIAPEDSIQDLEGDFHKINDLLSSLVEEVQHGLAEVWPILPMILKLVRKADNLLVDFSMTIARNGAWKFAKILASSSPQQRPELLSIRDRKVSRITDLICRHRLILRLLLRILRRWETGRPSEKIAALQQRVMF